MRLIRKDNPQINLKSNTVLFFVLFILMTNPVFSQSRLDTLLGNHLVECGELDSISYSEKVLKKVTKIEANFYVTKLKTFKAEDIELEVFKFESFVSHRKYHLAIVPSNKTDNIFFVDGNDIDKELLGMIGYLNKYNVGSLVKINLMRLVLNEYPE